MTVWSSEGDDLLLRVRLTPGAKGEGIGGRWTDEQGVVWLAARVRAVPEKGRANAALIVLIAGMLDWPKTTISLESGDTNRLKRLRIKGGNEALDRLTAVIDARTDGQVQA